LLRFEVILEAEKSGRGTQTYVANPNVVDVILNVLRRRERKMLTRTQSSFESLAKLPNEMVQSAQISKPRIEALGKMIQQAQDAFNGILELTSVDFNSWSSLNQSAEAN
jgi:hypothetical protein